MPRNDFTSDALTEGTEWTFVHSNGKRTLYVYTSCIAVRAAPTGEKLGLDAMHRLTNPDTDKDAMVSEKWLREGALGLASSPTGLNSHWLFGNHVEMAQAA